MDSNLPFCHHRWENDLAEETSLDGFLSASELARTDCDFLRIAFVSVLRLRLLFLIGVLIKDVSVSCEFLATVGCRHD